MSPVIHQISIPNPFFEEQNRIYVIATDPVTLIDTGIATSKAFEQLEFELGQHGLRVRDVRRVVLTHKHIDHVGNAWRIQQVSGAEIWIHQSECDEVVNADPEGRKFFGLVAERIKQWQAPVRIESEAFARVMPRWEIEPAEVKGLVDGQRLEFDHGDLEVLHTPGHTVGSICLRDEDRLFTGDHVLPDMSPNIGGGDLEHRGLLKQFFVSLKRIERLEHGLLAMPGHGDPFTTLAPRCVELIGHHDRRLEQIRTVLCGGPLTVYELAVNLFGEMDDFHVVLGCAEAEAHLEWLVENHQVQASPDNQRFVAV